MKANLILLPLAVLWCSGCADSSATKDAWTEFRQCSRMDGSLAQREAAYAELKRSESREPTTMVPSIEGPSFWGQQGNVNYATFAIGFDSLFLIQLDGRGHVVSSGFYETPKGRRYSSKEKFWRHYE